MLPTNSSILVNGVSSPTAKIEAAKSILYDGVSNLQQKAIAAGTLAQLGDSAVQANNDSGSDYYNPNAAAQAKATADEVAAYNDSISSLDQLLGNVSAERKNGLADILAQYNGARTNLGNQIQQGRDQSELNRVGGIGDVDKYANTSFKNLQRLLSTSHAGRSSVSEQLIPYLLQQAAGSRRAGVFKNAAQNEQNLDYTLRQGELDLENQRKGQESDFIKGVDTTANDLENQKRNLIIQREMANGLGYEAAAAKAADLKSSIGSRMNEMRNLFGTYRKNYVNPEVKPLNQFAVDKMPVNYYQQAAQATNNPLNNWNKKKEETLV